MYQRDMDEKVKCMYLVTANDMDDDKHVGEGNEPLRLGERHEDVLIDTTAKGPVPNECDGEVADRDNDVGDEGTLPHGLLRWLLRRGRDGSLDLQHHVVPRIRERDVP